MKAASQRITGGRRAGAGDFRRPGEPPLVSVILPVMNAAGSLAGAVAGILRQGLGPRELIVVDGGSGDGTLDVLRGLDTRVDHWESGPDRGIYDAMNRGVDAARGEWLYFMGVDDAFHDDDTLAALVAVDPPPAGADLVVGRVLTADGRLFCSRFDARLLLKNTVHHQSALYRRRVFERFRYGGRAGGRIPYRVSGDYQLNLRLFLEGRRAHAVDRVVARCGSGLSRQGRWVGYLEEILIRHGELPFWAAFPFDLETLVRYILKRARLARSRKHCG